MPDVLPLVTVITITYNSSKYINDAINSVLNNSYQNFELIISDDNSSDNTWEIINKFKDPRIKKVRNPKNIGEYPNRNQSIRLANGEFIIFIDGDDILLYRGIENVVKEMIRFPECAFGVVRPENPKFIGPLKVQEIDALNLEILGSGILESALCNNVFRTDFLKEKLLFNQYRNSDTYSRIYFSFFHPVLILIDPIAIWRISSGQASTKISEVTRRKELNDFYYNYLLPLNQQFRYLNELSLKRKYYRNLIRCYIDRLRSFRSTKDLKPYLIDSFTDLYKIVFSEKKATYWNEYNYENINIYFKK